MPTKTFIEAIREGMAEEMRRDETTIVMGEDVGIKGGVFLATDGLFETFLSVLAGFGAYPAVVARELDRYLPFLATTKVLVAALRQGVGREQAHEAIKEHAVAAALALREGADNDLARVLLLDG